MKRKLISLFLGIMLFIQMKGQNDLVLYNMPFIPQSHTVRPGSIPKTDSHLGLPFISAQQAGFFNTGFAPSDFLIRRADDSINIRPLGLLNALRSKNYFGGFWGTDWISASTRLGKNFIYISSSEHVQWSFAYPTDLFKLLLQGNGQFIGKEVNVGDFEFDVSHYRKQSLGYTRQINQKLNVGIKMSLLYGKLNIHSDKNSVTLFTDPTTYALTLGIGYSLQTAGLDSSILRNPGRYWFNPDNRGYSIDLGGEYQLNKKIHLSASLLDIGRINWNRYTKSYQSSGDIKFTFSGLDVLEFATGKDSISGMFRYLDSLKEALTPKVGYEGYYTRLFPRVFLNGSYQLNKNHFVHFTYFQDIGKGLYNPYLMAGYFLRLNKLIQLTGTFGYGNRRLTNLGFGMNVNLNNTQFYIMSDNIFPVFNPLNSQNYHIRVGVNLISGFNKSQINYFDKDEDGVEDSKDECPDVAGTIQTKGCPDKDGDLISDKIDRCPAEPGPLWLKGCPDSDQDSIADPDDSCIYAAGFRYTSGCPDTDFDSIPDDRDKCPNQKGLAAFQGCPDTDQDGIPDREDLCPDKPGGIIFRGCPDTDGDSLPDIEDKCPLLAGPLKLGGCPDSDNDGISDPLDLCPNEPGPAFLQGCPQTDKDGDGIPDKEDLCPEVSGSVENRGCPVTPNNPTSNPKDNFVLLDSIAQEINKSIKFIYDSDMLEAEGADLLSYLSQILASQTIYKLGILELSNPESYYTKQIEKIMSILFEKGVKKEQIVFYKNPQNTKSKFEFKILK